MEPVMHDLANAISTVREAREKLQALEVAYLKIVEAKKVADAELAYSRRELEHVAGELADKKKQLREVIEFVTGQ
jgi:hypothetical protein